MIKVSVIYPNASDAEFDVDYYCNQHIPMVRDLLGSACTNAAVEVGVCGATPSDRPPNIAMGHLSFDSLTQFQEAFGPNAEQITSDFKNYTNVIPVIQISEVKL